MSKADEKSVNSRMVVNKQFTKYGKLIKEENEEGEIAVHCFPDSVEPAKVSITQGMTINTGNYNSVKISATVTVPCYTEELGEAKMFAEDFCTEIMKEKVKKVKGL
jgi:hypothetical protein